MKPVVQTKNRKVIQQPHIDETERRLSIIRSFLETWELWLNDPKLQVSINVEEFRNIYAHMSAYFTVTYLNGYKISYDGRNILIPGKKTNQSASNKSVPLSNNKSSIQRAQNETPENTEATGQREIEFQFMGQLDFKLNRRYCAACLRYIPATTYMVDQHIKSRDHQRSVKMLKLIKRGKDAMSLPHFPWNSDPFMGEIDEREKCYCVGCRIYVNAINNDLETHVKTPKHREYVLQLVRDFEIMQLNSDNTEEQFFIKEINKYKRHCLVCFCDVDSDKFSLNTHIKGANHQKRLQQLAQVQNPANAMSAPATIVESSSFKMENHSNYNFIGEINDKKNQRYCLVCACFLPVNEKIIIQHVKHIVHDTNVVNFLQMMDSLESASYRLICPLTNSWEGQYCYLCNCDIGPDENDLKIHTRDFNHLLNLQIFSCKVENESLYRLFNEMYFKWSQMVNRFLQKGFWNLKKNDERYFVKEKQKEYRAVRELATIL